MVVVAGVVLNHQHLLSTTYTAIQIFGVSLIYLFIFTEVNAFVEQVKHISDQKWRKKVK